MIAIYRGVARDAGFPFIELKSNLHATLTGEESSTAATQICELLEHKVRLGFLLFIDRLVAWNVDKHR